MKVTLSNKVYTFLISCQKEDKYRIAFNDLVKKIFGVTFEDWYRAGYWNEKYIPYTLFDGERAVANVSVNIMDFNIFGEQQRYIQIGTVLTDEDYRHINLSRFLMEEVVETWAEKCGLIYLFANKAVLEMYPKFGFTKVKEYEHFKTIEKNIEHSDAKKLNMDMQSNRDMLYVYAKNSVAFGKLSMQENADLVIFYCTSALKENVYYIKSLDVIAITKFNANQLYLWDIFGKTKIELDKIIYSLANSYTETIVLGFTPEDYSSYKVRELSGDDTLFVYGNNTKLFDENKLMFPLLSHA